MRFLKPESAEELDNKSKEKETVAVVNLQEVQDAAAATAAATAATTANQDTTQPEDQPKSPLTTSEQQSNSQQQTTTSTSQEAEAKTQEQPSTPQSPPQKRAPLTPSGKFRVVFVAVNPAEDSQLLVGYSDGTVVLWALKTRRVIRRFTSKGHVCAM